MRIYHDSQSLDCRAPFGAVTTGTLIRLRIYVEGKPQHVFIRMWSSGEQLLEMKNSYSNAYEARVFAPETPMIWWYYFIVVDENGRKYYLGNTLDRLGGAGDIYDDIPSSFQITVYESSFYPPKYLREGIMYQIFPDRFARSRVPVCARKDVLIHKDWHEIPFIDPDARSGDNQAMDFYGGDLKGVIEKLSYLRDLGITIIYLNPVFRARTNHRYDTGDYFQIDPMLGTEEDLHSLCEKALESGIRILLDGVFSHTGDDSIYFNRYGTYNSVGAYQSPKSEFFEWYKFSNYPDKYACWWGVPSLPEINKDSPSYRDFIFGNNGVALYWMRKGTSGWRLDVADEIPVSFLRLLRTSVKSESPDASLIGEVWEDASNKVAYGEMRSYCLGDTVDSVMNYPLRDAVVSFLTAKIDAYLLVRIVRSLQENYPVPFFYSLMNLTGSHDRARILNVLSEQEYNEIPWAERGGKKLTTEKRSLAINRYRKMLSIYAALPGFPSIYYGDEAGMEGASDPFCRMPFPWGLCDPLVSDITAAMIKLRRSRPVLWSGALDIRAENSNSIVIRRFPISGFDVFGEKMEDIDYTLRVSNI